MNVRPQTDLRREPRNEILSERRVGVVVQRRSDGTDKTILGELKNLSYGGVQMALPTHLSFSEEVELLVDVPDADVTITGTATVCWIRHD